MLIILLFFLLNSLIYILRPHQLIGCGLTGFCSNNGAKANPLYLQLIAAYNVDRGTDSCGMYINNDVFTGIDKTADVREFLSVNPIIYEEGAKDKNIMIHNRKSSSGSKTAANCHPFFLKNPNNQRELFIQHNGTITNIRQLCVKYDVPYEIDNVDSKKLGEIILKTGNYNVLSEYEGGAALMMIYSDEPNTMYIFKGASKEYRAAYATEERPLYALEVKEGIYFSSLKEPLLTIQNGNQELKITDVPSNKVIKVQKNKTSIVQTIDRSLINDEIEYWNQFGNYSRNNLYEKAKGVSIDLNKKYNHSMVGLSNHDVFNETFYFGMHNDILYKHMTYLSGRYYTYMNKDKKSISELTNQHLSVSSHDKQLELLEGSYTITHTNSNFSHTVIKVESDELLLKEYFVWGVHLDKKKLTKWMAKKMYTKLSNLYTSNIEEFLKQLSSYSTHPVFPTEGECLKLIQSKKHIGWFDQGKKIIGTFTFAPQYSYREYNIKDGHLIKISTQRIVDSIIKKKSNSLVLIPSHTEFTNNPLEDDVIPNEGAANDVYPSYSFYSESLFWEIEITKNKQHIPSIENNVLIYRDTDYSIHIYDDMFSIKGSDFIDLFIQQLWLATSCSKYKTKIELINAYWYYYNKTDIYTFIESTLLLEPMDILHFTIEAYIDDKFYANTLTD